MFMCRVVLRWNILSLTFLLFMNSPVMYIASQLNEATDISAASSAQTSRPYPIPLPNASPVNATSTESLHLTPTELYPSFISEEGLFSVLPITSAISATELESDDLLQAKTAQLNSISQTSLSQKAAASDIIASDFTFLSPLYLAEQSSYVPHITLMRKLESNDLFQEETSEISSISASALRQPDAVSDIVAKDLIFPSPQYLFNQSIYDPHIALTLIKQPLNTEAVSIQVTETRSINGGTSSLEEVTVTPTAYNRSNLVITDTDEFSSLVEAISRQNISSSQHEFNEGIDVMPTVTRILSNQSTYLKMRSVSSSLYRLSDAKSHSSNDSMKLDYAFVKSTCVSCDDYSGSSQEANKTEKTKESVYVMASTYYGLEGELTVVPDSHNSSKMSLPHTIVPEHVALPVTSVVDLERKGTPVQNVSGTLYDLGSRKDSVAPDTVHVTTLYIHSISASEDSANISGVNIPRKISQNAVATHQLTEDQPSDGNRNLKILFHSFRSTDRVENEPSDLRCPVYIPETASHKFVVKFLVLKNTSVQQDLPKTFEAMLRKALNDSHCHSVVRMSFFDGYPFVFTWTNASVNSYSCPQSDVNQIYKKMVNDEGIQTSFASAFHPDFQIVDITVKDAGICSSTRSNSMHVILISLFSFILIVVAVVALCIFVSRKNSLKRGDSDSFILRPRSPFIFDDERKVAKFKGDAQTNRDISCDCHNSSNPNICLKIIQKSKTLVEELNEQISDINVCLNCEVQRPCGSHMCSTPKNV